MRQRRLKNEINVVPYIDVMLVLLVIFMVATPMMSTGEVKLPTVGSAPEKPPVYLRVQIGKDGALSVSSSEGGDARKLTGVAELTKELKSGQGAIPNLLIAGDEEVPYGDVMKVFEAVKSLGFERVGLETSSH